MRAVVDCFPAAIYFKDKAGHYTRVNQLFRDWYKVKDQDYLGKTPADYFPEKDSAIYAEYDRQVLEEHKVIEVDLLAQYPDGVERSMTIVKFPVMDSKGNAIGVGAVNLDITEQKRGEEALRESMKGADQANREKSKFLASMSHEFRTPLNAIMGFSELLSSEIYGELGSLKYQEYANDIHASSGHLLNLVNDILDLFSR